MNDPSNTRGPKAARLQDNAKGKFAKKLESWKGARLQVKAKGERAKNTGSRKDEPPPLIENPDETREDEPPPPEEDPNEAREESNEEALQCAFTVACIWFHAHHIHC